MKTIWLFFIMVIATYKFSEAQTGISYSSLVERQGIVYQVNSQVPYSGNTFQLYGNGQKEFEGSYLKGEKNGKWTSWFSNGQKEFVGNYKNGNYDGRILKYAYNGQVIEDCGYLNGIFHGKCSFYYDSGNLKFNGWYNKGQYDSLITEYDDKGNLLKKILYNVGVLNGIYIDYSSNGKWVNCIYKNGNLNGNYTEYHHSGKPAMVGYYENNLKEGKFIYNYPNGNLKRVVFYVHGYKEGESTFYCDGETFAPDKSMRAKMIYTHDKLNGKYIAWKKVGAMDSPWIADESDWNLDKPGSDIYAKIEGCFIDGKPNGIFKYWLTGILKDNPTNKYQRQIWDNGQLIDNGWSKGGHIVEYNPDGSLTDYYKQYFQDDARFTKKYDFPCESNSLISDQKGSSIQLQSDEISLAKGKEIWIKNCSVCHKMDGSGSIGPNLTDNYWIHNNTVQDLYNTITSGVPIKGMMPYKEILTPSERLNVISY